jgi:4-azaleucine resistance transporter AzlC
METTITFRSERAGPRPAERKQEPGSIRAGARAVAPLAAGSVGFGVSFGLLARAGDLGWPAPLVMSMTAFTGTAQFAAVSVLTAGGSLFGAIAAAACLNARYVAMSIAAAPSFRGNFASRLLRSQFIVDEAWAIANRGRGRFDLKLLLGAGIVLWVSWVSGTAIGLFGGAVLSHPERLGLDAVAPALFLALLARHAHGRGAAAAALATLVSLSFVPVLPAGLPIVAASLAAAIGWWSR